MPKLQISGEMSKVQIRGDVIVTTNVHNFLRGAVYF